MKTIILYRYTREDGGMTVSPEKPETDYTEMSRLVADDGHILTNGTDYTFCVDTDNPSEWTEVVETEDPSYEERTKERSNAERHETSNESEVN